MTVQCWNGGFEEHHDDTLWCVYISLNDDHIRCFKWSLVESISTANDWNAYTCIYFLCVRMNLFVLCHGKHKFLISNTYTKRLLSHWLGLVITTETWKFVVSIVMCYAFGCEIRSENCIISAIRLLKCLHMPGDLPAGNECIAGTTCIIFLGHTEINLSITRRFRQPTIYSQISSSSSSWFISIRWSNTGSINNTDICNMIPTLAPRQNYSSTQRHRKNSFGWQIWHYRQWKYWFSL